MRSKLFPALFFTLLLGCTKSVENTIPIEPEEEPVIQICDEKLPGYLIVDEKKHNACELVVILDTLVESDLGFPADQKHDGIILDINEDGRGDFKIYPFGYHALSGGGFGMSIESLQDSFYFAATDVLEFNICIMYRPFGGIYVSCREYCSDYLEAELIPEVDTISRVERTKYVEAFSPGDIIHDSLIWVQAENHFFKRYSEHNAEHKCWPESKWQNRRDNNQYFIPIKQITASGTTAFGWIKLQYGGYVNDSPIRGIVPNAFVFETYIQKE